jgi:hypothetical protein
MSDATVTTADQLRDALKSAKGGETIVAQGAFGAVALAEIRPASTVTIVGTAGAHFEKIDMRGCANLHWTGLSCWPIRSVAELSVNQSGQPGKAIPYLVMADPASENIELSNCIFRGRKDSDNHASWGLTDWQDAKIGAVILHGPKGIVRSNKAIGVSFGFTVRGASSEIFDNLVFGFSGDGLRVGGDNSVVIGNRVTDAVLIDKNHPDALQAFKPKELLKGLVIKDNVILEWTVRRDNPLRAKLQGIGMHDGPYSDVVIRDNRISSSSYNGIRVHGTTNVELVGNQVRHADGLRGQFPRIRLDGCSGRIIVQNNKAEKFVPPADASNGKPDYSQAW